MRNATGQVLLVRTEAAGWELPGGRVEDGEALFDALRREVLEEAGCTLDGIGRLSGVYHVVESGLVLLVFRAVSNNSKPVPSSTDEDVRDARWFDAVEALEAVTHAREHARLADGLADATATIVRSD